MATVASANLPNDGMIDLGFDSEEEYNNPGKVAEDPPAAPDVERPYENQNSDKLNDNLNGGAGENNEGAADGDNVPKLKEKEATKAWRRPTYWTYRPGTPCTCDLPDTQSRQGGR